jgi:hypothetical protein
MGKISMASIAAFIVMGAGWVLPGQARAQAGSSKPLRAIEGKLLEGAHGPQLQTGSKVYSLTSDSPSLLHTLSDPRLRLRDVKLEGREKPDGQFEVAHLFTVKNGQLYKVRYYCNVCNIVAQEPGPCVCCQRPTELEEIPLKEVTPDTIVVP